MHFTVNLRGEKTYQDDFSYGLVFIPCPVWVKGVKEILNLNPERPDYVKGSIAKLMNSEKLSDKLTGEKQANILIHDIGHGSDDDLTNLINDLKEEGFRVSVYEKRS